MIWPLTNQRRVFKLFCRSALVTWHSFYKITTLIICSLKFHNYVILCYNHHFSWELISYSPWVVSNKMTHTHMTKKFQPWSSEFLLWPFAVTCIHALSYSAELKRGISFHPPSVTLKSEIIRCQPKKLRQILCSAKAKLFTVLSSSYTCSWLQTALEYWT